MEIYKESHYRSLIKALSWRVLATVATIMIVYVFTRRWVLSLEVGMVEVILKLILYYFHERIWGMLGLGRKSHPLTTLAIKNNLTAEDVEVIKEKLKQLGYIQE